MRFKGVRAVAASSLAALVVVAAAGAKTIRGTAGADTIRGTPRADVILGLGGNDRLFGMGGNDRLVGGPGADRISCGPGRDRVSADLRDRVAADCELVSRPNPPAPPAPPPPPPPPPTPPPPPPPPPPGPLVGPGHYVSNTPQGRYVHFDVDADGRRLRNLRVEFNAACRPDGRLEGGFGTVPGPITITTSRTFTVDASNADRSFVLTMQGQFDALNNVTGQFRGQVVHIEQGVRYDCDSGTVPFSGRRG